MLNRREFLQQTILGVGALYASKLMLGCSSLPLGNRKGELVFFATDPTLTKNGMSAVCVLDPATGQLTNIPVQMELAHGCFPNPGHPEQVFVVEQGGPRACAVNLNSREVKNLKPASDEFDFYGHGLFLNGGDFFVMTEVNRATKEGRIAVRRADTFAVADVIPSYGKHPHDLRLLHGGTVLVTANHGSGKEYGKDSSVSFLDLEGKKLLHQVGISEPGSFASHLEVIADDEVLVACRRVEPKHDAESERIRKDMNDPAKRTQAQRDNWKTVEYREAPLYWIRDGKVLAEEKPDELSGRMKNSLSLAFAPSSGTLGITHLDGDIVSFWDVRSRKLRKVLETPGGHPHGLAYLEEDDAFVVGLVQGLAFVDGKTLERKAQLVQAPYGVHIGKTRC